MWFKRELVKYLVIGDDQAPANGLRTFQRTKSSRLDSIRDHSRLLYLLRRAAWTLWSLDHSCTMPLRTWGLYCGVMFRLEISPVYRMRRH